MKEDVKEILMKLVGILIRFKKHGEGWRAISSFKGISGPTQCTTIRIDS